MQHPCISASVSFRESVGDQKLLLGVKYIVHTGSLYLFYCIRRARPPDVFLKSPYCALQLTLKNARYGQCLGWVVQAKMSSELLQLKPLPWE